MKRILDVPYISQRVGYCGPACLTMALNYLGFGISQNKIADKIGLVDFFGSTLNDLSNVSKDFGFNPKIAKGTLSTIIDSINLNQPLIVLQQKDFSEKSPHYRIIIGYDNASPSIFYHDPEGYKKKQSSYFSTFFELGKPYQNIVLIIKTPNPFMENSIKF